MLRRAQGCRVDEEKCEAERSCQGCGRGEAEACNTMRRLRGDQAGLSSAHPLTAGVAGAGSLGHCWAWLLACPNSWTFLPSLSIYTPNNSPYQLLACPGSSLRASRGLSSQLGCQVGKERAPGVNGAPGQCWAPLLFLFLARTQQKSTFLCICCSHFSKGFICLHLHKKYHTPILMRPIWQYRPPLTGFCSVESCTGQGCDN